MAHAPAASAPDAPGLIIDPRAVLDAACSTALVRVGAVFRSMVRLSGGRFCPNVVCALVRDGLLFWRVSGEIAEVTHAGKTRAALTRARQRNAAQMRALNLSLQRKETP
ncbi:MAG: hypothetical protein Q8M31_00855 [Beijerinckiaceae bacterium]|nr:hypothetical protein [Beijerinckiaceae bacterium]